MALSIVSFWTLIPASRAERRAMTWQMVTEISASTGAGV